MAVGQVVFPFSFIALAILMGDAALAIQLAVLPTAFEPVMVVIDQHALALEMAGHHLAVIAPAIAPTHHDGAIHGHAARKGAGEALEFRAIVGETGGAIAFG